MAEPKAQTLIQRFGFMDHELKTPLHDEMMLWTDNNAWPIFNSVIGWTSTSTWTMERKAKLMYDYLQKRQLDYLLTEIPLKPDKLEVSTKWESPVLDKKYTIGFIDMIITCKVPYLWIDGVDPDSLSIPRGPRSIGGGWEEKLEDIEWAIYYTDYRIAVEVKPTIPSLGELIRQIRMYETYTGSLPFVIVCPDDRFKQPIENQGIKFYRYSP